MSQVAVIFLTPHCNMRCDFCGAEAGFDPMPFDSAAALVDRLASEGTKSVVLGGGEPFLWGGDIYALARRVRQRGMLVQVGSNGTLAPKDDASLEEFDRWILPIESADSMIHDQMRHFSGGHQHKVLHLMDRLQKQSVELTVSSLVTNENIDQLLQVGSLLQWYAEHGGRLHAWHLYRFLPVGRGGRLHAERFATHDGLFEAFGDLLKRRFDNLRIYLRPDMYHSKQTSFYWYQAGAEQSLKALQAFERA